jgi:cellulose synthase/poly-beta-1,6-N-acetylglucosamine synthase-like glycosyltransferase
MLMSRTSVIIPVRNGSNFLAEAIASALAQLGPEDQVIVAWDASTDDTQAIGERITHARVRAIRGPERGVSGARNAGLAVAEGEFIAFLDHDDLLPQGRHRTTTKALQDNPRIDATFWRMRIRLEPKATPWQWLVDTFQAPILGLPCSAAAFCGGTTDSTKACASARTWITSPGCGKRECASICAMSMV